MFRKLEFQNLQHKSFKCSCCQTDQTKRAGSKLYPFVPERPDLYLVCKNCVRQMEILRCESIQQFTTWAKNVQT